MLVNINSLKIKVFCLFELFVFDDVLITSLKLILQGSDWGNLCVIS